MCTCGPLLRHLAVCSYRSTYLWRTAKSHKTLLFGAHLWNSLKGTKHLDWSQKTGELTVVQAFLVFSNKLSPTSTLWNNMKLKCFTTFVIIAILNMIMSWLFSWLVSKGILGETLTFKIHTNILQYVSGFEKRSNPSFFCVHKEIWAFNPS